MGRTKKDIKKELDDLKRAHGRHVWRTKEKKNKNAIYFFEPLASSRRVLEYQQMPFDAFRNGQHIVIMPAPNKIGKTAFSSCMVISWALGYEPWTLMPAGDPDAVEVDGVWYRKSCLGKTPPVRIRITGEDWAHSIGQTIVPELKKWAPAGKYTTRKNSNGVEYYWEWVNGSTFEIMTHEQDPKLYESWLGDGWWPDEPPPHQIWSAMSRGLFTTGGKVLMPTTPLREAWVLDELILSGRPDVTVVDGLTLWDNPMLYDHDLAVLTDTGIPDAKARDFFDISIQDIRDETENNLEYLKEIVSEATNSEDEALVLYGDIYRKLKIQRFVEDTPKELRKTRMLGEFHALSGRVLKDYIPNIHDIDPFPVPTDWPVTVLIDFHLGKPQALSFYAVDKRGIHYIIDEVWENLDAEGIADEIIRRKKKHSLNITRASIDPLSKGDVGYIKNRFGNVQDSFTIIRDKLTPHGILLEVGSKDIVSGISNINSMLRGVNGIPTLYNFRTNKMHRHHFQRWVFEDKGDRKGKPRKENDDFGENTYRYTIMNIIYVDLHKLRRNMVEPELGIV